MKKPGILSKKVFLAALVLAALAMMSIPQALAVNLNFGDITASKYDWARPYIEKMFLSDIVKGVDTAGTKFAPDNSIKRDEFVTMLIRLMGLEEEAKAKSLPSDFPNASAVPSWARGYVAEAVEKDIISGNDLQDFRPEDSAKRYEVAVFAVRALGLEQEVQSMKNVDLTFTDKYLIPMEAAAYVQVAVENGIIRGIPDANGQYSFKPNDPITRAQAAVLLSNLSKKMSKTGMIIGTVQDVDSLLLPSVTVKLSNGSFSTYTVNNSTSIYKEDDQGSLSKIKINDITVGDNVGIIPGTTGSNIASYIEITSDKDPTTSDDTADEETAIQGTLIYIPSSTSDYLIIRNDDTNKSESYTLSSSVSVKKDGKSAGLSTLAPYDMATITVSGGKVIKIVAESQTKYVSGTIKAISFSGKNPTITIEDEDENEEDYELDEDADIRRNSRSADINDLKKGDEVDITLEYNIIVDIRAKSVKKDISGTVKSINISDTPQVTITDEDGDDYTFNITSDTEIIKDRKEITVYDLRAGYYLDMEVESDDAVSIDVTTVEIQSRIEGSVQYIHKDAKVIVISVKDASGTKTSKEIHYTDDTVFMRSSSKISVSRVDIGDQVLVVGTLDSGLLFADTIIDLTISD